MKLKTNNPMERLFLRKLGEEPKWSVPSLMVTKTPSTRQHEEQPELPPTTEKRKIIDSTFRVERPDSLSLDESAD